MGRNCRRKRNITRLAILAVDLQSGVFMWVSIAADFTHQAEFFLSNSKARYNDKEYVITQPFNDNRSFSAVREVLMAEFKLLAQCARIKEESDKLIQDSGIQVPGMLLVKLIMNQNQFLPAFYFNFKDSFYREIELLSASGCRTLPHLGFLATLLLPCGRYDDPVRKFIGSDNLGPAKDNLTQAIHAFVHFAWVYSQEQLLFCDMQGL